MHSGRIHQTVHHKTQTYTSLRAGRSGQSLIEYGVLLSLVVVVCVASFSDFGAILKDQLSLAYSYGDERDSSVFVTGNNGGSGGNIQVNPSQGNNGQPGGTGVNNEGPVNSVLNNNLPAALPTNTTIPQMPATTAVPPNQDTGNNGGTSSQTPIQGFPGGSAMQMNQAQPTPQTANAPNSSSLDELLGLASNSNLSSMVETTGVKGEGKAFGQDTFEEAKNQLQKQLDSGQITQEQFAQGQQELNQMLRVSEIQNKIAAVANDSVQVVTIDGRQMTISEAQSLLTREQSKLNTAKP